MNWKKWSSSISLTFAGVLAILLVSVMSPPSGPSPKDTPVEEFSSKRALAYTTELLGDQAPHPTGSEANAAVRERILIQLRTLGLQPEVQALWVCPPASPCGLSHNILARIGAPNGPAVGLSAHYDSVAAGPGASDDAAGVGALLELARLLIHSAPHPNPILLLITDGEESGLLGAHAFGDHRWSKDLTAIVNLEASGTSGPSTLFETSPRDAWIIGMYTESASQPTTGSMFAELYGMTAHQTDFTIHLQRGVDGANFAYTESGQYYHTPLDDLAHLDEGSLRHQGESAAGLITALAKSDLNARSDDQWVYQDVMNAFVVSWPVGVNLILVLLAMLLLGYVVYSARRRSVATLGQSFSGLGAFSLALFFAFALGSVASIAVDLMTNGHPAPWWVYPAPFRLLYALVSVIAVLGAARILGRRAGGWGVWIGVWSAWALLALTAALIAPSFTAIFLLPLAVAVISGVVVVSIKGEHAPPLAAPSFMMLLVWLPIGDSLASSGFASALLSVSPIFLMLSPIFPLAIRASQKYFGRALSITSALLIGALIIIAVAPRADEEHPVGINFVTFQDADSDASRTDVEVMWHFAAAPAAVIPEALVSQLEISPGPPFSAFVATKHLDALPPKTTLSEDTKTLTLQSQRGATVYQICTNAGVTLPGGVVSEGTWNLEAKKCRVHRFFGPHQGPLELRLEPSKAPLVLWASDEQFILAPPAAALAKDRGPHSLPFHEGDRAIVGRWVRDLKP